MPSTFSCRLPIASAIGGHEADGIAAHALLHHVIEPDEGSAADEQDLAGIDLDTVLVWMLAATLRGNVGHGAFQHF